MTTWREVRYGNIVVDDFGSQWKVQGLVYWKWINAARVPTPDPAFADGMTVGFRSIPDDNVANVEVDPNAAVELAGEPWPEIHETAPGLAAIIRSQERTQDAVHAAAEQLQEPLEAEGGAGAQVIADEANSDLQAASEATVFEPFEMPEVKEIASVLSHLYLVHGMHFSELPEEHLHQLQMLHQHHLVCHKDGPMPNIHTHTKEG